MDPSQTAREKSAIFIRRPEVRDRIFDGRTFLELLVSIVFLTYFHF
jgi:hypothetical protein